MLIGLGLKGRKLVPHHDHLEDWEVHHHFGSLQDLEIGIS